MIIFNACYLKTLALKILFTLLDIPIGLDLDKIGILSEQIFGGRLEIIRI